ncbi:uncharacterized protein LOC113155615 [Anabas testudineus]|uniref:uncharacterized protein LOC113155615 n=1 Tax=Anabas testudineus TaxID=64144 RepID=UPI000E4647BC|nr:uncharacterized protein LOC113155615 [Anabas testudineus]
MDRVVALLVFVLVSQHALGVEVHEGVGSVVLTCHVDVGVSERSTVVWTREELKYPKIHIRQPSGDDHEEQNQYYMNRTSMRTDALQTGDLSLTLRRPTIRDSGTYTCTVRRIGQELNRTDVQLQVTEPPPIWLWIAAAVLGPLILLALIFGTIAFLANKAMKDRLNQQLKVAEVTEGAEEVDLPCTTAADLSGSISVEWRRSVPKYKIIHVYKNGSNQPVAGYESRTEMKQNPQNEGVLTLNLKNPHLDDGGVYICTVYKDGEILRQKIVVLSVRETWIKTIRGLFHCFSNNSTDPTDPTPLMDLQTC